MVMRPGLMLSLSSTLIPNLSKLVMAPDPRISPLDSERLQMPTSSSACCVNSEPLQDVAILQWNGICSQLPDPELWSLQVAEALHLRRVIFTCETT